MPLYQRRRPSPIRVFRRQEATPTITGAPGAEETLSPESPDSPFSSPSTVGGLSSPDSPEPTGVGAEAAEGEESEDEAEEPEAPESSGAPKASLTAPVAASTSQVGPPPAIAAPTASSTAPPQQVASSAPTASASSAPSVSSSASSSTRIVAAPQVTGASSSADPDITRPSTLQTSSVADISFSNKNASPARPTTSAGPGPSPESVGSEGGAAPGQEPPQRTQSRGGMSHAAEAALITFTILGGVAILIGVFIFLKKRRRARETAFRHAESAFDPGNTGSLTQPETVHIATDSHFTRSTNATTSLFGAGHYERPETVSTDRGNAASRIPPTPNPFADPPLNKAYDVLRGRPRSTTLTDRGSWDKNPFQDPVSDRFDPFGELQERARMERVRYMEELRHEEELLGRERERIGAETMSVPLRKGSGVTVEGVGVLDRSGDGRGFER
ncbi:hypothetical protein B0J11DRAFT_263782 [Dendryphion nanum]|uniref:Uncharacterized protein n=1 Tax=Dendryphion nanum TaxID=256645 RepID=A0A9P9DXG6_9PLEO|nr:hypothetical protein B0J11DRAFT_263782 [Dendryphion nanum]